MLCVFMRLFLSQNLDSNLCNIRALMMWCIIVCYSPPRSELMRHVRKKKDTSLLLARSMRCRRRRIESTRKKTSFFIFPPFSRNKIVVEIEIIDVTRRYRYADDYIIIICKVSRNLKLQRVNEEDLLFLFSLQ